MSAATPNQLAFTGAPVAALGILGGILGAMAVVMGKIARNGARRRVG